MTFTGVRRYLVIATFIFACRPSGAAVTFSGVVTDPSGAGVPAIQVIVYPAQRSVSDGSDQIFTATNATGQFKVSVPGYGAYFVCTEGAVSPLLDLCSVGQYASVSVDQSSVLHPFSFVLAQGVRISILVRDANARLLSSDTDVVMTVDSGTTAPVSKKDAGETTMVFVFTVPQHATGRLIVRSALPALIDGSGAQIPKGVPSLPWSADRDSTIQITAQ